VQHESRFRAYVVAAAGLFTLVAGLQFLALAAQIAQQRLETSTVNVAGRQRLLTARTARLADQLFETKLGPETQRIRGRIVTSTRELERNQDLLALGGDGQPRGWPPASVRTLNETPPFELRRRIAHFAMGARSLTGAERAPRAIVAAVGRQSDTIIPLLDRVVDAYVADAERQQTLLIWEEAGGLCTLALLLALEIAFIFRPLVRAIDRSRQHAASEAAEARRISEALTKSERRLSLLIQQLPAVLWTTDENLRFTSSLGAGLAALGRRPNEAVGRSLEEVMARQDPGGVVVDAHRAALCGESGHCQNTSFGRTYQTHVEPQRDADGRVLGTIGVSLDVSEQQQTAAALQQSEAALARAQETARLGSWSVDLRSKSVTWSRELYRLLGLAPRAEPPNLDELRRLWHADDAAAVRAAVERARVTRRPYQIDRRIIRGDGAIRWVHQNGEYAYDAQGRAVLLTGTMLDITERKEAEERLAFQATHDLMTGLPNRRHLLNDLAARLRLTRHESSTVGLVSVAVDCFTSVDGTLGHEAGDEFIGCAAQRLTGCCGASSTLVYLQSGEFAIALDVMESSQTQRLAECIVVAFSKPLTVSLREIYANVSIGIAHAGLDGDEASELIRNAAAAMSEAKSAGRNLVRCYSATTRDAATARAALDVDLRRAVDEEQFHLNYQPIVAPTGRILGIEALLRWNHPVRGFVAPDAFIPLAEESGLIVDIGAWVLRQACNEMRRLRAYGFPGARVAVNVSVRQLADPHFEATVRTALSQANLEPDSLELEITESAIMQDVDVVLPLLARLQGRGIGISIDDFGTGYSSLAYLRRLPVNTLKIDKSFVRELAANHLDGAIARAIITLAHNLSLRVVAEGVENETQLAYLAHLGCDEMQGYFFSRPMAADALVAVLQHSHTLPVIIPYALNGDGATITEPSYAGRT